MDRLCCVGVVLCFRVACWLLGFVLSMKAVVAGGSSDKARAPGLFCSVVGLFVFSNMGWSVLQPTQPQLFGWVCATEAASWKAPRSQEIGWIGPPDRDAVGRLQGCGSVEVGGPKACVVLLSLKKFDWFFRLLSGLSPPQPLPINKQAHA